jgi:hypothetical protein
VILRPHSRSLRERPYRGARTPLLLRLWGSSLGRLRACDGRGYVPSVGPRLLGGSANASPQNENERFGPSVDVDQRSAFEQLASDSLYAAIMMRRRTKVTAWFTSASVMLSSNRDSSTTASTKRSRHSGGTPFAPCCMSASCSSDKANGRDLVIAVGIGWAMMN